MKKLIIAMAAGLLGFGLSAPAQLLYQWDFTNHADTATSSTPTVAATPGTGQLGLLNVSGDAITPGLIYFTNVNAGPPGGPGGALLLNGQAYGNPSAIATNSNLSLGTLYQFTFTYWVQYGPSVASGTQLARNVQFGASVNYDSGGKGGGNINGVGTALNGANTPSGAYGQFQDGIASASGSNPQVTITGNPDFTGGFVCDGQTWYFEAVTYDGFSTTTNFTVWLASTNLVTGTGTAGIDAFVQSQNRGGINFTTNASVLLAGCTGAARDISTGQIADVRIYNGVLSSNQLMTVRSFGYPAVSNPPAKPSVVQPPASGKTFVGGNRGFGVGVVGNPAVFTYLWRSNNVPIAGATNSSYTLANVAASASGAGFSCSISNVVGGVNSTAGVITVVPSIAGTYAQAVFTNQPYAFWLVNEPTNASTFVISDYANGNDGLALNTTSLLFDGGPASPWYAGFSANNTAIEVLQGESGRLNLPALPAYTNTGMTLCGWVYTPTAGLSGQGLIYSLPSDTANGFGLIFGGGNELDYQWGSTAVSGSGLIIPSAEWAFVALVVSTNLTQADIDDSISADTNATLYVGSISEGGLTSTTFSTALTGNNIPNGSSLATLALGRTTQSASENGGYYDVSDARFNDVAVFYKALSAGSVTNLYVAGAGLNALPLSIAPDPGTPGNLLVNWIIGTLQEATSVTGPYTDVSDGPTPPYSIPPTDAQHYYRLRN